MEREPIEVSHEKDKDGIRSEATGSTISAVSVEDASKVVRTSPISSLQVNAIAGKAGGIDGETLKNVDTSVQANKEVSVIAEDVIRAGGFGARDDISSFLPVASDWTDFEASIRNAKDYEEPQGEVSRPGLGWRATSERE